MHKGDIIEGTITELRFPNKGLLRTGEGPSCTEVLVKNTIPGQRVSARITKKRSARAEANLISVLTPSPLEITPACPKFGSCGGCQYLCLPEEEELRIKEEQVRSLLRTADSNVDQWYEGILESPVTEGYRNKMELTFGDEEKDGPLTLGMHCRGSFYDVTNADTCRLVDADYRKIIRAAREYWAGTGVSFYHRLRRKGYLRHLLIRKGMKTGEILVDLITTGQIPDPGSDTTGRNRGPEESTGAAAWADPVQSLPPERENELLTGFCSALLSLDLDGAICGILHTRNDSIADIVEDQGTEILYGKGSFNEELLGLDFTVTPFSFFQTNSAGAELLYKTAGNYILHSEAMEVGGTSRAGEDPPRAAADGRKPVVFDLYCGTGTISLLVAPAASKVIGVEIVEEAVLAARENAVRNGVTNCEFIAGDVLEVIDTVEEQPDLIILDPPRDGVHPKALPKILRCGVPYILYISCKPTSLVRDLPILREWGYEPIRGVSINEFPKTANVETVLLLSQRKAGA